MPTPFISVIAESERRALIKIYITWRGVIAAAASVDSGPLDYVALAEKKSAASSMRKARLGIFQPGGIRFEAPVCRRQSEGDASE
jgi:hypothetical protein